MDRFLGPHRIIGLGLRTVEGVVHAPEHVAALWNELHSITSNCIGCCTTGERSPAQPGP